MTQENLEGGQDSAFLGTVIFAGLLKKNVISKDTALKKGGGLVDTSCCNALLTGLKKSRDFERMNLLFSEMKDWAVAPDHFTSSIVLDRLCKTSRVDHALRMLEDFVRNQSNVVLYSCVIDGLCKSGRLEDALGLLENMKMKSGCSPDTVTYNCLIDGYCKTGDIDTANHLLKRMKDENVPFDMITANTLTDGMSKSAFPGIADHETLKSWIPSQYNRVKVKPQISCCGRLKAMHLPAAARRRRFDGLFSFCRLSSDPNCSSPNAKTSLADLFREPSPPSRTKTTPNRHADGGHTIKSPSFSSTDLPFVEWCQRCDIFTSKIRRMTQENLEGGQDSAFLGTVIFAGLLKKNVISKDAAEVLVEMVESGVFPQEDLLLRKLINRMCRSGHVGKAWDFVHTLKIGGGLVDTSCFNALLTGLKKSRDFERMNLLFSEMKDWAVPPNHITYLTVFDHLSKTNRVDHALRVLEDLSVRNQSNVVLYNCVIDGLCKSGRLKDALGLLENMKMKSGCSPDTVTYNCLIDGYCKAGDIDTANHLLKRMKDENVPFDMITVNTLTDGLCRVGRVGSALEFFHQQRSADSSLSGDTITYTTLMAGFVNAGNLHKAMHLREEMLRSGHKQNAFTYNIMISCFVQLGRVDEALSIAGQMQKDGFDLDVVSYSTLIGGFSKKQRPDEMRMLFDEMIKAGLKPDTVTYSTLIASLCKAGDMSAAKRFMEEMVNSGNKPNVITYGALIHGCCRIEKFDEGMTMFRRMTETGTKPDSVIYYILIVSLCRQGKIDDALSLLDVVKSERLVPTTPTYNAVFRCLCKSNSLAKAFEVMKDMKARGCHPNFSTLEILAGWFSGNGEIAKLKAFFHDNAFAELKDQRQTLTFVT